MPSSKVGVGPGPDRRLGHWWSTWVLLLMLAVPLGSRASSSIEVGEQLLLTLGLAAADDPHAAIERIHRELSSASESADLHAQFWLTLALAHSHTLLDQSTEADAAIGSAHRLLATLPAATPTHHLWTEIRAFHTKLTRDSIGVGAQLAALRPRLKDHASPSLACQIAFIDTWQAVEVASHDEGWIAAEQLERCALASHHPVMLAIARIEMARMLGQTLPEQHANLAPARARIASALEALGDAPFRHTRLNIAWEAGIILRRAGEIEEARDSYRQALALGRSLGDVNGMASALIALAEVESLLRRHLKALPLLDEAERLLLTLGPSPRLLTVHRARISALAALRSPQLPAAIAHANRLDARSALPQRQAELTRAIAEGHASMGNWEAAFQAMSRSAQLDEAARTLARDEQMLRLQARYDAALKQAENETLRHEGERRALQLSALAERERSLLFALLALVLALLATVGFGWRSWHRRRQLAELVMRDELTGLPNRRAIFAFGKAELAHAEGLGAPISVAMLDIDHFKHINDSRGHGYGDEVLRAFGDAARRSLRGSCRIGRIGGEEWLLILPGSTASELADIFDRIQASFSACTIKGDSETHRWTFSMGGVQASASNHDLNALVAAADAQLYRAKSEGRGRACVASAPD